MSALDPRFWRSPHGKRCLRDLSLLIIGAIVAWILLVILLRGRLPDCDIWSCH